MRLFASVLVLWLARATAFAADVDGTWSGTVSSPQGDTPVTFKFKAEGTKLTGSTTGFDGGDVAVANGKIDGAKISFDVTFDLGGMPFPISYTGVVAPNEIKMSADVFGMPLEFVLKKAGGPAAAAASAGGAAVDGTWTGTVAGPAGDTAVSFKFKADGAKLTGSTTGPGGSEVAISDGKIDGSKITFNVSLDFGGMPFMLAYEGAVAGEEIKMSIDVFGMAFEFTVKKSK
jgi:autotransporter translocation and assembly factor TamB